MPTEFFVETASRDFKRVLAVKIVMQIKLEDYEGTWPKSSELFKDERIENVSFVRVSLDSYFCRSAKMWDGLLFKVSSVVGIIAFSRGRVDDLKHY